MKLCLMLMVLRLVQLPRADGNFPDMLGVAQMVLLQSLKLTYGTRNVADEVVPSKIKDYRIKEFDTSFSLYARISTFFLFLFFFLPGQPKEGPSNFIQIWEMVTRISTLIRWSTKRKFLGEKSVDNSKSVLK